MKVLIVCESPRRPTGFGQQAKLIAEGLRDRGHEVICLSYSSASLDKLSPGLKELSFEINEIPSRIDGVVADIKPDVVFILRDIYNLARMIQESKFWYRVPTRVWLAYEGVRLTEQLQAIFKKLPDDVVVHMSKHAQKMWSACHKTKNYIPHGVDLSVFKPLGIPKAELRAKWTDKLNSYIGRNSFVVLCTERNDIRKRWDAVLDFCGRLVKAGKDVQLLAHTLPKRSLDEVPPGYDLFELDAMFGMEGRVVTTNFVWHKGLSLEEMVELYNLSDMRLTCSAAEGFGLGSIEASACKLPQINNGYGCTDTTFPEGSYSVTEPSGLYYSTGTLWEAPDVPAMVKRALNFESLQQAAEENYRFTVANFDANNILDQWANLLEEAVDNRQVYRARGNAALVEVLSLYYKLVTTWTTARIPPHLKRLLVVRDPGEWELARTVMQSGLSWDYLILTERPDDLSYLSSISLEDCNIYDLVLFGGGWPSNFDWKPLLTDVAAKAVHIAIASQTQGLTSVLTQEDLGKILKELNFKEREDATKFDKTDVRFKFVEHRLYQKDTGYLLPLNGVPNAPAEPKF